MCVISILSVGRVIWPPRVGEPLPRAEDAWCTQSKLKWILGKGHGPEWERVFHVGPNETDLVWSVITEAGLNFPVSGVRRTRAGIGCGVIANLAINGRTSPALTAWHYEQEGDPPRLVTHFRGPTIGAMAVAREIKVGDAVELPDAIETAPAGAGGNVTDLLDDGNVIVEVMTMPLEPILDRIVIAPPASLRIVKPA